jgi:heptosyltransferase-2
MRTLVSGKSAWEMRLLFAIIGPKVKAGRDTEGRGSFFDITIPESYAGDKYERDYDIEMAVKLGARDVDNRIDYRVDEESREKIARVLGEHGVAGDDVLIVVNPGGAPANRWPLERFTGAINEIYNKTNAKFVITGGAGEAGLALELGENINADAIDLAGKLSVKELSALIERCDLFITNDTGPMHIAAVLRKPLVAIFGPGHITRYDPRKVSDKAAVVYNKVECAPCNRKTCNSMRCLKGIPPGEVVEAALRLLGRT